MSKKNVYLWNKNIVSATLVPLFWFSAKTYYEENGEHVDEWQWHDPFIHDKSFDQTLEYLKENPPSVFGFSVYIWSHLMVDRLAKIIKERYPTCLIVYGGPQIDIKYSNDFFKLKPWVDIVVPSDVYGEPVLHYILDNHTALKHQDIPEVYYHKKGVKFRSSKKLVKRDFKWPKNIFLAQEDWFKFDKNNSYAIYETTRGCPYRCIYCDWGGGTYTKVTKKPRDTVYDELEYLAKNQIDFIFIADGNFGIFKDDIDVIYHIIDLREKYGYPRVVSIENAKNNLDRVVEIQKLLIKHQLSFWYKISIQNPHEEIKKNIDRVDIPFDDQINAILEIKKEYDAPILVETIIGLPGDNYQLTLDSIDLFHREEVESYRANIWNLLPEAPAYSPEMREKFEIETKWFEINSFTFSYKDSVKGDQDVIAMQEQDHNVMMLENVVGTYSYAPSEWCDMLAVTMISSISKVTGLTFLAKYLKEYYNAKASELYDTVYMDIIKKKKFQTDFLNKKIGSIPDHLNSVVSSPDLNKIEFDIDSEFPLVLAPHVYLTFLVMLEPKDFFETIGKILAEKYHDDRIIDLTEYLSNIMIDINYDINNPRQFISDNNWYGYFNHNEPLQNGKFEYKILDKLLKFTGTYNFEPSDYPEQTDRIQKMKQFFYHRASNQARIKYASSMELVNEIKN